jgi:hypothetical protein
MLSAFLFHASERSPPSKNKNSKLKLVLDFHSLKILCKLINSELISEKILHLIFSEHEFYLC